MSATTARVLPAEEWAEKLIGTSLEGFPGNPAHCFIVVVEQDGRVVSCWAAMTTVHVEGLWQAEDVRGHAGVGRALLTTMLRALATHGVGEILTQSITPEVDQLIEAAGGRRVPGQTWVLKIGGA